MMTPSIRLACSNGSRNSKLHSVKPRMLPAGSSSWPPLLTKVARLVEKRPEIAEVIEDIVDDYLEDVL